jgi:hypothetical protein
MDGVLVDFEYAVVGLLNRLLEGEPLPGAEMTKGYFKRLRKVQSELGPDWRAKNHADLNIKSVRNFMMGAIAANPGPVFASMPALPDGVNQLWPFLTSSGHIVNILSAPIRARSGAAMTSEEGKALWVQEWLDPISPPNEIIITPAVSKPDYAMLGGVPNVLVDDKASTVTAWNDATEAAGFGRGFGVLHIPGNSGATIRALQELGL